MMYCVLELKMCEIALLSSSARLGVGMPIILAAVLVMHLSLAQLVTDSKLKKQFCCFVDIEVQMVVFAPLSEV